MLRRRPIDEPDNGNCLGRVDRQTIEYGPVPVDEALAHDEILRWVPGDGELRKQQDVCVVGLGPIHRLENAILVVFEITDAEVDLCSGNPDRCHRGKCRGVTEQLALTPIPGGP